MDVAKLHAALARKRTRRVHHRWGPGKIGLEPNQVRKVLGHCTGYETVPSWQQRRAALRVTLQRRVTLRTRLGQHNVGREGCKLALQFSELPLEIDIALGTHTKVKMQRLRKAAMQCGFDDRLDRRKAAAARHAQHRTGMLRAQV